MRRQLVVIAPERSIGIIPSEKIGWIDDSIGSSRRLGCGAVCQRVRRTGTGCDFTVITADQRGLFDRSYNAVVKTPEKTDPGERHTGMHHRHQPGVVMRIRTVGQSAGFQIAGTADRPRLFPGGIQRRQQHGRQDGDDCNYDKQFYKSEQAGKVVLKASGT